MFDAIGQCNTRMREYLRSLEVELRRPIMVTAPMAGASAPLLWESAHLLEFREAIGDPDYSVEQAEVEGIQILPWTVPVDSRCRFQDGHVWPAAAYTDGHDRERMLYDLLAPRDGIETVDCPFTLMNAAGEEHVLGEIHPRHVYYYRAFDHWPERNHLNLDRLLGDPIRQCCSDTFAADMMQRQQERGLERFRRWVQDTTQQSGSSLQQQYEHNEQAHAMQVEGLATTVRTMEQLRIQMEALARVQQRPESEWMAMYEALSAHPRLTYVSFDAQNRLVLLTEPLTLHHPDGRTVELGRFRIQLGANDTSIRLQNLDNPRQGRHHPHVPQNQQPCFGEAGTQIALFMGMREYVPLADLLINWLESFNLEDAWGTHAAMWFDGIDTIDENLEDEYVEDDELELDEDVFNTERAEA